MAQEFNDFSSTSPVAWRFQPEKIVSTRQNFNETKVKKHHH